MTTLSEKVVKKGIFNGVTYPRGKKYACNNGELTLTSKHLSVNCEGKWKKTFRNVEIKLKAHGEALEIRGGWYGSLRFALITNESEEWLNVFEKTLYEEHKKVFLSEEWKKRPEEWTRLLDIDQETLKKAYYEIGKEMAHFRRKNIRFNLEIHRFIKNLRNRKLKAYIIAHSYVAWYEWTKGLLSKLYKAKFGKGPKNDEELIKFIRDFHSLRILDTEKWDIKANQMRNCVAHENFYYDYTNSEVVFIIDEKEKRVNLRELEWELRYISDTYLDLLNFIGEKLVKGKISPPLEGLF